MIFRNHPHAPQSLCRGDGSTGRISSHFKPSGSPDETGETIADTAKTLSRFVDGIMIRANRHEDVMDLAKFASIPVISGLTDKEHPCQILSDLFTIYEQKKLNSFEDLKKIKITYLGDGNNVTHSLILAAAIFGMEIAVASPKNYEPEKEYVRKGLEIAKKPARKFPSSPTASSLFKRGYPLYGCLGFDGKRRRKRNRREIFKPYQINVSLLPFAKPECFDYALPPAHRGEEVSEEVMDGPKSVVFEQAENRLHTKKQSSSIYFKDKQKEARCKM